MVNAGDGDDTVRIFLNEFVSRAIVTPPISMMQVKYCAVSYRRNWAFLIFVSSWELSLCQY